MTSIHEFFPSKYLKAAQLKEAFDLTIRTVTREELGDDVKPVLYFEGKGQGMALNKTQAMAVTDLYGETIETWIGEMIRIQPGKTQYQGKTVDTIVVTAVPNEAKDPPAPGGDDIPF